MVLSLTLSDVRVILLVEFAGGSYLLLAGGDLNGHGTAEGTRPVLERHTRVPQVRVLERDHLETCARDGI